MRRQISNFVYGLLDYAAYPFGMLTLAPIVLRDLGAAQYGVWAVATATVSFGSIVASGFGDANIQQVATRRGTGGGDSLLRAVRASFGIHLDSRDCDGSPAIGIRADSGGSALNL